jgi:hypothetical protein
VGLPVIDLNEFMKRQQQQQQQHQKVPVHTWCNANLDRNVTNIRDRRHCDMTPELKYPQLVDHVQQQATLQHGRALSSGSKERHDCAVMNIGSAFTLRNDFSVNPAASAFADYFDNFPIQGDWKRILQVLYPRPSYSMMVIGVHVRTKDHEKSCERNRELYAPAAKRIWELVLEQQSSSSSNNGTTNDPPPPPLVLVGRVNSNSTKCLNRALGHEQESLNLTTTSATVMPKVVTVNDLIAELQQQHQQQQQPGDHPSVQELIHRLPLEVSTVYLILDQLLLSLCHELVLQSAFPSTFQMYLRKRHAHRLQNLKELGLLV